MTVAPDGTIYWVERYSATNNWKGRLRKLAPDGIVTTVAGAGDKVAENGNAAAEVALGSDPKGVAIGPDGSIYLAIGLDKKVVKIDPGRRTTRFAGKGVATERGEDRDRRQGERVLHRLAVVDRRLQRRHGLHPLVGYDVAPSASVILKVDDNGTLQQYAGAHARHLRHRRARRRGRDQHLHAEPLDDDRRGRRRRR